MVEEQMKRRKWRYTLLVVLMGLTVELDVAGDRKKARKYFE